MSQLWVFRAALSLLLVGELSTSSGGGEIGYEQIQNNNLFT